MNFASRSLVFCVLAALLCLSSADWSGEPFFPEKFEVEVTYRLPEMGIEEPIYVVYDSYDKELFMDHYHGRSSSWMYLHDENKDNFVRIFEWSWHGDKKTCFGFDDTTMVTAQPRLLAPSLPILSADSPDAPYFLWL